MYLAAGNLFMGTFDMNSALTDALKATRLGWPYEHNPLYLKGYFKYKAGSEYTDKDVKVAGKKDKWDVYAIFYETDENTNYIDATVRFTDSHLISIARLSDDQRIETDNWTEFFIPFVMQPGKTIDSNKLKAGKYNLAIVFSSSINGDTFQGAIGSTLDIDEVEVINAVE